MKKSPELIAISQFFRYLLIRSSDNGMREGEKLSEGEGEKLSEREGEKLREKERDLIKFPLVCTIHLDLNL